MNGPYYDRALTLADDDPDLLDEVHAALMKHGLSEETYAQVFAALFFNNQEPDKRISCSSVENVWKKGTQTLSDIKLFAALNQCCDLIRCYALASWENCVFSAWASRKEVTKAEKEMDSLESLAHAKNILTLAAPMMPNNECESRINWDEKGDAGEGDIP